MVSPPEPAAGTSTGGSWITSSCAPESTRTVASGSVSEPGPRRAASSATRKRTARMPAAPGGEVRDIKPDDPRRPEVVAIREAIERATEMTRRLFKLGAVQPLESELVDLNDLVRTTEQELSALAGDRIAVATALEPRFSPITADPRE